MNLAGTFDRKRVLIVGAGPVGLSLAIELGLRGVTCVIIERNDRVGHAPRAKTTHVRTREHFRRWGIADKLAERSPLGIDYPSNVIFATKLGGYKLAEFNDAFHCAPQRNSLYSEHAQWIPQYALEEVLRRHAESLPSVEMLFKCEFLSCQQDAGSIQTRVRNIETGLEHTLESDFLVGADGARSAVRTSIGAQMQGAYGLSRNYNFVFRAPGLAQAHELGPAIMYWQVNSELPSVVGPMDTGDRWFFMPTQLPDGLNLSTSDAPSLIARAIGIDLDYESLSTDEWVASRLIADKYRDGRIFLAGDACHVHPPFGGYGMNMGIADAVDLGWKIAAVCQGWGGASLLDSYAQERRSVHEYVMDEAVANHSVLANHLWQEGLDASTEVGAVMRREVGSRIRQSKSREFHNLGVVLGYRYAASPIVVDDGSEPPPQDSQRYVPSAHPGCLAPHAWLRDGRSLYDTFGPGFTLLVTREGRRADVERAMKEASDLAIPLTVVTPDDSAIADLYQAAFALIRPDQHVAWRGNSWPDRGGLLPRVTGLLPGRRIPPLEGGQSCG
jgi:2-polyprenyl-6-methoxyphenol hydroxylase-like FAD-dependent oxidoreductase